MKTVSHVLKIVAWASSVAPVASVSTASPTLVMKLAASPVPARGAGVSEASGRRPARTPGGGGATDDDEAVEVLPDHVLHHFPRKNLPRRSHRTQELPRNSLGLDGGTLDCS